jgi:hypothetical protein
MMAEKAMPIYYLSESTKKNPEPQLLMIYFLFKKKVTNSTLNIGMKNCF